MERMVFLLPILDKNSLRMSDLEVKIEQIKCETVTGHPPPNVVNSMKRLRQMKANIRTALQNYKYKQLLKVLERYRLKYVRNVREMKCEVIDLVEENLKQCTSYERTNFLQWYYRLVRRRIDRAVINEKLNYRIY